MHFLMLPDSEIRSDFIIRGSVGIAILTLGLVNVGG